MALSSQRIKAILICAMQFSEKGIEFAKFYICENEQVLTEVISLNRNEAESVMSLRVWP